MDSATEKWAPASNDGEFVDQCYRYLLLRDPDEAGKLHFLAMLKRGGSRQDVLLAIVSSDEFHAKFNEVDRPPANAGTQSVFVQEGHFYSPIPAREHCARHYDAMALDEADAISVDEEAQLRLAAVFAEYYRELPFSTHQSGERRYHLDNGAFNYFDGIILYSVIRHVKPKRIIEVGSGFSSAAMIDTCELFLNGATDITFIEPYPDTLHKCLRPQDGQRYTVIEKRVQDVPLDVFRTLERNDILFIDSSHVAKFGSDLNYLLFKVLPILQEGVLIHFHDIFKNFDYPKEWLLEGRAWNEGYLLKALLAHNRDFKVLFFNDWFAHRHWDYLKENMPLCTVQPAGSPFKNSGVSLWLRYGNDDMDNS